MGDGGRKGLELEVMYVEKKYLRGWVGKRATERGAGGL